MWEKLELVQPFAASVPASRREPPYPTEHLVPSCLCLGSPQTALLWEWGYAQSNARQERTAVVAVLATWCSAVTAQAPIKGVKGWAGPRN